FPVAGTLMIEPTVSESRTELNRFCDSMLAIPPETRTIKDGVWPGNNNPLVNAPHTAATIMADDWSHPYSWQQAGTPTGDRQANIYWPPVGRVHNAFGDRNLICACPALNSW
ncbi:MAG: glycine dehydrogenase (aminomethyl-transferring), partial [Pseudomonadota bacterium]|nr:glycine dehydrogenase (aminomethyl-transferring) [Pseudomonadota bacterium]